jgi:hypothetical protein
MEAPTHFSTVLPLIAAPAVFTNAASVLALNTANRMGRVVDHARRLAAELTALGAADPKFRLRVRQMQRLRVRAQLLMRAQSAIYSALGLFVATALLAVVGAGVSATSPHASSWMEVGSLSAGVVATGGMLHGCQLIVRETRLALESVREEVETFEAEVPPHGARPV